MYSLTNKNVSVKKGQDLYVCCCCDNGKVEIDTYKISTINKNGIYLILINEWTWGNRAAIGKRFSYTKNIGFLPNIPNEFKKYYRNEETLFQQMGKTKLAALKMERPERYLDEKEAEIAKRNISRMISKLKAKK